MLGELLGIRRLLKNRTLSADELNDLRDRKLRAVVRHAYDSVPYYRSLFDSAGLSPEDIKGAEDLDRVPVTTKEDLRRAGLNNIVAKGIDPSGCTTVPTSGTTGQPFTAYLTRGDVAARRKVEFRSLLSIGFRPADRLAVLGPSMPHRKRLHQRLGIFRSINISPLIAFEEQVERLKMMRPTVLWAYPTVLRALIERLDYRLSSIISPRALITGAEVFDDILRKRVLSDLELETFNFYGCNETGRIAWECAAHEGLHVNTDHVILEALDGELHPGPGTRGGSVVTTLNALGMPFIRYRLGDIITFLDKECSCGMPFPLIGPPEGRAWEMFRLSDGATLPALALHYIVWRFHDRVDIFRFTQNSYNSLDLELVPRGRTDGDMIEEIRSRITGLVGKQVSFDIHIKDSIRDDNLKFSSFVSKLPRENL
jgi:phenylacetate-CoA ligase